MKFKKGDVVKITERKYGHHFKIGSKVRIKEERHESSDYEASYLNGRASWYIADDEIEELK